MRTERKSTAEVVTCREGKIEKRVVLLEWTFEHHMPPVPFIAQPSHTVPDYEILGHVTIMELTDNLIRRFAERDPLLIQYYSPEG